MQNQLQVFTSNEFGDIGVLMIEGKPFFPATECAKILGYKDPYAAISMHSKGSVKRRVLTKGGEQTINFISEGDLYRLISHSQLPAAQRFESFVFDEVLPSIRKYGVYMTDESFCTYSREKPMFRAFLRVRLCAGRHVAGFIGGWRLFFCLGRQGNR